MKKSDLDLKKLLSEMTVEEKVGQLIQINAMFLGETEANITGPMESLCLTDSIIKKVGSTDRKSVV